MSCDRGVGKGLCVGFEAKWTERTYSNGLTTGKGLRGRVVGVVVGPAKSSSMGVCDLSSLGQLAHASDGECQLHVQTGTS
jgi:hypothetical protein